MLLTTLILQNPTRHEMIIVFMTLWRCAWHHGVCYWASTASPGCEEWKSIALLTMLTICADKNTNLSERWLQEPWSLLTTQLLLLGEEKTQTSGTGTPYYDLLILVMIIVQGATSNSLCYAVKPCVGSCNIRYINQQITVIYIEKPINYFINKSVIHTASQSIHFYRINHSTKTIHQSSNQ